MLEFAIHSLVRFVALDGQFSLFRMLRWLQFATCEATLHVPRLTIGTISYDLKIKHNIYYTFDMRMIAGMTSMMMMTTFVMMIVDKSVQDTSSFLPSM